MKAIILLAGYAVRLYPLTKDKPKALLTINDQPLMDLLFEKLDKIKQIDEAILISNARFYKNFVDWSKTYKGNKKITVLNDGTTCNEDRLGAIGDLIFAIKECKIDEDIMVLAGDHYFKFELKDFYNFYQKYETDCCIGDIIEDKEYLKQFGVGVLNKDNILIEMQEKPQNPKSNYRILAFYLYKRSTLPLLNTYIKEGNNPDSPGNFLSWLYKRQPVHVYIVDKECVDIGTLNVYQALDKRVREENKK